MSTHPGLVAAQVPTPLNSAERLKPTEPLPTDRISPQNQLEILRAWASVSNKGARAATVNEVATKVGMAASTVAMTNPFFSSIGFLQRLAKGTYVPSKEVVAFSAAKNGVAGRSLAPLFRDSWFGKLITSELRREPMDEQSLLLALEDASASDQEQRKSLGFILDFMETVDLIERNKNNKIQLTPFGSEPPRMIPAISRDGSSYCVSVRVDSKVLAESLVELFVQLAALVGKK